MKSMKVIVEFVFFLILILGGIYFGSQNIEPIRIMVLGRLLDPMPLWFALLVSFGLGAVLAGCFFSYELIKLWFEAKRLRKEQEKTPEPISSQIEPRSSDDKEFSSSLSSPLKSSSDSFSNYDGLGSSTTSTSTSTVRPSYIPPPSIRQPPID